MEAVENINILLCGKNWSDVLTKEVQPKEFTYYDITKFRPIQALEFNSKLVRHPGVTNLRQDENLLRILNTDTDQPSILATKISYLAAKADVVLIDTEFLDTAIAHEIFKSCGDSRKIWGIGVRVSPAALAPAYIKGIMFPQHVDEIRDLILNVYRTCRPKKTEAEEAKELTKEVNKDHVGEPQG